MTMRMAFAAGLMICVPWLTSAQQAGCKVTLSQYNQLRNGMSVEEAVRILGCKGKDPVFSQLEPHVYERYRWDGNAPRSMMTATFRGEKLIEKSQSGLQ